MRRWHVVGVLIASIFAMMRLRFGRDGGGGMTAASTSQVAAASILVDARGEVGDGSGGGDGDGT